MELTRAANESRFTFSDPLDEGQPRPAHWPTGPAGVTLWRLEGTGEREEFALLGSVTYREQGGRRITVPGANFADYRTDLTSVPDWFTWLVPRSGRHLPAALIHDGLVEGPSDYRLEPPGPPVDRIDADVIFRNAMLDTKVGLIRRWLVWAAVSAWSLWGRPRLVWPRRNRRYYRAVMSLSGVVIAYLGLCATLDLFDIGFPGVLDLPWMLEGPWWSEALGGLAGAIAIPLVMSAAWLRHWRVGAIIGVLVAALLHVTVAVALALTLYRVTEWGVRKSAPGMALLAAAAVAASFGYFAWLILR